MAFITSQRSELLVNWQHIGSFTGEWREPSLFPTFETNSSQWTSNLKVILLKEEAKAELAA